MAACGQEIPTTANIAHPPSSEKVVYVGPWLVESLGVAPQKCMLVKEDPAAEYRMFYGEIEGFDFQEGYEYRLTVSEEQLQDVPADSSSFKWTLVSVDSKIPVSSGLEGILWGLISYMGAEDELVGPMKMMMPQLVASMSAFIPGRDVGLARQECEAKMEVMQLVQDVRKICPDRSVHVPLAEIVAKAYALGSFPALWAVEGIGHDLVEARHHRGESLTDLLTSKEVGDLPDGSLTMLHAGIGLGLAELALDNLRPDSPTVKMDAALRKFLDDCTSSSRTGYVGCALESLGLVTRHFYGHSMVLAVDKRLEGIDETMRGFFWHGVGRAVYFSPDNMLPGLSSPW